MKKSKVWVIVVNNILYFLTLMYAKIDDVIVTQKTLLFEDDLKNKINEK